MPQKSSPELVLILPDPTPDDALQTLTKADAHYLQHREALVTDGLRASMAAARALYEIYTYKDGLLWRSAGHAAFGDYCQARWGYNRSYAYRLCECGSFMHQLATSQSPIGDWPTHEGQVRPILKLPEPDRVRFWHDLTKQAPVATLTAKAVTAHTAAYVEKKQIPVPRRRRNSTLHHAQRALKTFAAAVHQLPTDRKRPLWPLLEKIVALLE